MPAFISIPFTRRRIAGGLLVCLGLLLIAARSWDQHLKEAPHAGFLPGDTVWRVYAPDGAALWEAWNRTPAAASLSKEAPFLMQSAELTVRQATGIRPTPERWRVWMGTSLLVGGADEAWGGCVRPGLLLHLAAWLHHFSPDGDRRWGDFYYAWREGFFLFSPSEAFIDAALTASPMMGEGMGDLAATEMEAVWRSYHAALRIKADDRLSVEARSGRFFEKSVHTPPEKEGRVSLPDFGDKEPLITIATADNELNRLLLETLASRLPGEASLSGRLRAEAAEEWPTAPFWNREENAQYPLPDTFTAALYGLSPEIPWPIPDAAFAWPENKDTLSPPEGALPYTWENAMGWLAPILDDRFAWCHAFRQGWHYAATNEPRMAAWISESMDEKPRDTAAILRINWTGIGRALPSLLRYYAEKGLIPGIYDVRALDQAYFPLLRVLESLHSAEFRIYPAEEEWRVSGSLSGVAADE